MSLKSIFSILLLTASCCFGAVYDNNDFELWLYDSFQKEINNEWSYRLEAEFRLADGASFLYLTYAQFLFLYQPFDWFEVAGGYRHLGIIPPGENELQTTYSPLGDIVFYFSSGKWKWIDRSRIQYLIPTERAPERVHPEHANAWVYRQRLRLVTPWKLTRIKLTPFVDDEVFFIERAGFFQNRFAVGGLVQSLDPFLLKVFYILRHRKIFKQWQHQNILGIYLSFKH